MATPRRQRVPILVIGLDDAGKSTLLDALSSSSERKPASLGHPTVGFSLVRFNHSSLRILALDMSGQGRYRDLWMHQLAAVEAIVWVMDCTDRARFYTVKEELEVVLSSPLLPRRTPFLVYANKSDMVAGALGPREIAAALDLPTLMAGRDWLVCGCVARDGKHGKGVSAGMDWLVGRMNDASRKT